MPRDSKRSNSRSRSRSPARRSRSRSRSRSKSTGRKRDSYRNDRGRDRSRSNNRDDQEEARLHIADLTEKVSQHDIEKAFGKFGDVKEVWLAKNPPCFAFVVFKKKDDANTALKEMDQRTIGSCRIRVTVARPRARDGPRTRNSFGSSMKCYNCGRPGHFSRDCDSGGKSSGYRRRSSSRDRRGGGGSSRKYSRSRSPRRSRSNSRNRNRSRSPRRDRK